MEQNTHPSRNLSRRAFYCAAFLCLSLGPAVIAGAWTPKKGQLYLKLSANEFRSGANFTVDGDSFDPFADFDDRFSRFRDQNISLYLELGLHDRLALIGGVIYKELRQTTKLANLEIGLDNQGFADLDLGLRYRLSTGANVWSVAVMAKLPYLYENDKNFFALGNAQEDLEVRLQYGRSLGNGFYGGLEAGYRLRLEDPSDEYRYLAELGWSKQKFYTRTKLEGILAVDDFEQFRNSGNPILSPGYDLTTWLFTAGVSFSKAWHLEYTHSTTIAGKNTADGTNNQVAVVFTF